MRTSTKVGDAFGAVDGLSYLQPAVRRTEFLELPQSFGTASIRTVSFKTAYHSQTCVEVPRKTLWWDKGALSPHELASRLLVFVVQRPTHQADFRAIGSAFFRCDISPCFLHIFPSILFCAAMMRSLRTTPRIRSRMESINRVCAL